ncbi:L,D-transpeptidase [Frankia sp. R43]|uniref:L,D-transpeptidase n=1 Tax=Frankia sp. R43 TaxID=269536 RepID=UPI000A5521A9|nr:L,D-transpeptidase [Frankia sp. R43]
MAGRGVARVLGVLAAAVSVFALAGCGGQVTGEARGPWPVARPGPSIVPPDAGRGGDEPGHADDPRPADATILALPAGWAWVAYATVPRLEIFADRRGGEPRWTLDNPNPRGITLVLGVEERQRDWLRVRVPVRPNNSIGWVRAADVRLTTTPYELLVDRRAHRLTVFRDGAVAAKLPVGIGTGSTPTPRGVFYLTELLRPADPNGPWGPFAFGLSGFSDVITQFNGADGIIGLHGTNRPDLVGSDVSMGCIRLRNDDLLRLVGLVPLGTPITIVG